MKFGSITTLSMFFFFAASALAAPSPELDARQEPTCKVAYTDQTDIEEYRILIFRQNQKLEPHSECNKWLKEMDACYYDKPKVLVLDAGFGAVTEKSRCATAVTMWFSLDCPGDAGWECM